MIAYSAYRTNNEVLTVTFSVRILARDVQKHPDQLQNGHDERAEGDGAKGERGGADERRQRGMLRLTMKMPMISCIRWRKVQKGCTIKPCSRGPK